jgi:Ca2+-binding EF-hand superfamily protein
MTKSDVKFANSLNDALNDAIKYENGNRMSRAVTAALILGNKSSIVTSSTRASTSSGSTSPTLTSSTRASTPSSINSSRAGTPPSVAPHSVAKVEQCQCCDIDEFRKAYDSFCLMDKRACGVVRRCDFWEAFTEHLTNEMQCTISKAKLHQRFRSSSADMTLEELIGRAWPTATDADRKTMNHWAKLHDAFLIVSSSSFRGTRQNIKQVFDLLDFDGSGMLSVSELVRARILTKGESQKLMKDWHEMFDGRNSSESLNLGEFKLLTQKHLIEKYANGLRDVSCRSAFHSSKEKDSFRRSTTIADVLSRHAALNPGNIVMAC